MAEVVRLLLYVLSGGWHYITADSETQLGLVASFAVQVVVGLLAFGATRPFLHRDAHAMTKLILKLALVFGIQGVLAWFFYRCRVILHASWAGSDFVVFGLPLLFGFAIAAYVLFFGFQPKRIAAAFGLSVVGAVVASFVGTLIAFNLYGT